MRDQTQHWQECMHSTAARTQGLPCQRENEWPAGSASATRCFIAHNEPQLAAPEESTVQTVATGVNTPYNNSVLMNKCCVARPALEAYDSRTSKLIRVPSHPRQSCLGISKRPKGESVSTAWSARPHLGGLGAVSGGDARSRRVHDGFAQLQQRFRLREGAVIKFMTQERVWFFIYLAKVVEPCEQETKVCDMPKVTKSC